jgi:hypothetical protein
MKGKGTLGVEIREGKAASRKAKAMLKQLCTGHEVYEIVIGNKARGSRTEGLRFAGKCHCGVGEKSMTANGREEARGCEPEGRTHMKSTPRSFISTDGRRILIQNTFVSPHECPLMPCSAAFSSFSRSTLLSEPPKRDGFNGDDVPVVGLALSFSKASNSASEKFL